MNREGGTVRARLSFPLFVGKIWEYTWKNPHPFLGDYTHDFFATFTTKVEVTAYEPVTVGAGTFDAFKIEATSTQWGESLNPFRAIEYYSPQLGVIKRHSFSSGKEIYSYDIDDELVSYTRAQAGGARR